MNQLQVHVSGCNFLALLLMWGLLMLTPTSKVHGLNIMQEMYHWMLWRSAAQALDRAHELHVVIVQSSYDYGQSLQVINIIHISLRCTLSGRPEVRGTHGGMKVESNRCPISTYYFSKSACSLYSALPCTTSSTSLLLSVTVHALHLNDREDIGWHKICGYQEHRRVAVSVRHMCAGYDTHLIGIYVLS